MELQKIKKMVGVATGIYLISWLIFIVISGNLNINNICEESTNIARNCEISIKYQFWNISDIGTYIIFPITIIISALFSYMIITSDNGGKENEINT